MLDEEIISGPQEESDHLNIEGGFVWLVIRTDENNKWHVQGVGTNEGMAVSMCVDETYFIGPVPVNSPLPEQVIQWIGSYFPHKKHQ